MNRFFNHAFDIEFNDVLISILAFFCAAVVLFFISRVVYKIYSMGFHNIVNEIRRNMIHKKCRHKWQRERRINKAVSMVFNLRRCQKCSRVEIYHGGGSGDKKWHLFDGTFRFDWEKEWFEKAVIEDPETIF